MAPAVCFSMYDLCMVFAYVVCCCCSCCCCCCCCGGGGGGGGVCVCACLVVLVHMIMFVCRGPGLSESDFPCRFCAGLEPVPAEQGSVPTAHSYVSDYGAWAHPPPPPPPTLQALTSPYHQAWWVLVLQPPFPRGSHRVHKGAVRAPCTGRQPGCLSHRCPPPPHHYRTQGSFCDREHRG
jgi:hypothetical protein